MKNSKNNGANAQVNASDVQVSAQMAQVKDNKSTLAGQQEEVFKTLVRNMRAQKRERATINGRLIDLASVAGDYASIVKCGEFKGAVKTSLDHIALIQTDGAGNVTGEYVIPVKFVALESRQSYADYKIEDLVCTYMGRKSAKNWSLASYAHDGGEVLTTNFADLRHEYTHEVTRMQSAVAADGTQVSVPVFTTDENGNKKVVKDSVTEVYVPVVCDTCSDRQFENAVKKAIEMMWLKLFAK